MCSTCFHEDDRLVTFNLGMATIWNATSGEELHRLSNAPDRTHGAAVSLGGDLVATCGIRQVIPSREGGTGG